MMSSSLVEIHTALFKGMAMNTYQKAPMGMFLACLKKFSQYLGCKTKLIDSARFIRFVSNTNWSFHGIALVDCKSFDLSCGFLRHANSDM